MDGLFSLIWVIFIVVAITNSITGKNKKKQQKRTGVPPFTAQPVNRPAKPADFRQFRELVAQEMQSAQQAQQKSAQPEQTRMNVEDMMPSRPASQPVVAPKVHTHLSMDCDQDDPSGSMDFVSTEGVDPCHDDELPGRSIPRSGVPVMQEQPGLALEWTSDALVRSVIMQEVLTRPSQRQRR